MQKKLVRIITCSSYRAHTEPLMAANNLVSIADTDIYIYIYIWHVFLCTNACMTIYLTFIISMYTILISMPKNTRQASDLHVVHGRLDIRRTSMKTPGANTWNSIFLCVKESTSIKISKPRLRKCLIDQKMFPHFDVHNWYHTLFWLYRSKWSYMHADYLDMCNWSYGS